MLINTADNWVAKVLFTPHKVLSERLDRWQMSSSETRPKQWRVEHGRLLPAQAVIPLLVDDDLSTRMRVFFCQISGPLLPFEVFYPASSEPHFRDTTVDSQLNQFATCSMGLTRLTRI